MEINLSDTAPEGHVVSQAPAPGWMKQIGSPVDVVVSLGVHYVTVPDVALRG